MRRLTWFAVLTLGWVSIAAGGGQPAAAQEAGAPAQPANAAGGHAEIAQRYRQLADDLQAGLPTRELTVADVPKRTISLRGTDPQILENKFAAEIVLAPAIADPEAGKGLPQTTALLIQADLNSLAQYPPELLGLLHVRNQFLLHRLSRSRYPDNRSDRVSAGEHFRRLAASCPAEARPAKEPLDFLTSSAADRDVWFSSKSLDDLTQNTITVFAPTAEAAEQRARAIVRLYDVGFSRPMQSYFLTEGDKALGRIAAALDELNALQAKIAVEQESLKKPSDISPDVLSQLKTQKVLVAIELAGLSARIKACETKLNEPKKLDAGTLQSIGEVKITAEIERVGVQEKLDQINTFIAEGDARQAARARWINLQGQRNRLQGEFHELERQARGHADLFALYAPFRVADNQISVGSIEWATE